MQQVMPLAENFRENLRSALEKKRMTQRELANKSGVHYVTICNILAGKAEPSLTICEALAKSAGIKIPEIFSESR